MNTKLRATFLVVAIAGLSACASMGERSLAASPTSSSSSATIIVDYARMDKIEQAARVRGVDVQWYNPPMKRRASKAGDD